MPRCSYKFLGLLTACSWIVSGASANTEQIVTRSDIVLQRPNLQPSEAMPLGNGRLGVAVWAADGLTLQLNRADTLPGRLSPSQIVIPGLAAMNSATDYGGRLHLYNGEFVAHGGGMAATVYVQPDVDALVIHVTGADPQAKQSVLIRLWEPRRPTVQISEKSAVLSETWTDSSAAGATGKTFGSLAAITVLDSPVQVEANGPRSARLSFRPRSDGSFQIVVAAPEWTGGNSLHDAQALLTAASSRAPDAHRLWWNKIWQRTDAIELRSEDGSAEYLENLRMIYLFTAAAENGGRFPGSQAGVADLFSSLRDFHKWDPGAYWHFNLRMQVAAHLSAGVPEWNEPYFRLYRENLPSIEEWTRSRMRGLPGACIPETMRFNGQGFENEGWTKTPGLDCDAGSPPYYNARTISTGAEVSLWIWRQYVATDDRAFLAANYPVMAASARFLLAYSKPGRDGKRHTAPSNAHENQWDVTDPTTDISAMRALFPALIEAARVLGRDADLAAEAKAALRSIPDFPRTDMQTLKKQLTAEDDRGKEDAIAQSWNQNAPIHNTENVGLEPVWPYDLIGEHSPLQELAVRTFQSRPNKMENDWSFDPLQAARLGLAEDVRTTLLGLTQKYQAYPSGMAHFIDAEFYVEQTGVVAAALAEALVQEYDNLILVAPAWPKEWDAHGTVAVAHRSQVEVEMRSGLAGPVAFRSGFTRRARFRDPWPGMKTSVRESGRAIASQHSGDVIEFACERGHSYVLSTSAREAPPHSRYPPYDSGPRFLGNRSIGLGHGPR